jgi:hypothetical protein
LVAARLPARELPQLELVVAGETSFPAVLQVLVLPREMLTLVFHKPEALVALALQPVAVAVAVATLAVAVAEATRCLLGSTAVAVEAAQVTPTSHTRHPWLIRQETAPATGRLFSATVTRQR